MARSSNATDDWRLNTTAGGVLSGSTGPFTIAFWFKSGDNTQVQSYIMESQDSPVTKEWAIIYEYVDDQIEFFKSSEPAVRAGTQIPITDTNWHHIAYRKSGAGTSAWDKFLDGAKTAINGSIDFTLHDGLTRFSLFAVDVAGDWLEETNGALADVVIYTVALSDAQIAQLAGGLHSSLLGVVAAHGWDLLGDSPEPDRYGGLSLTVNGPVVVDHPSLTRGRPHSGIRTRAAIVDVRARN